MFEDDNREGAKRKSDTKRTEEVFCVRSFETLMEDPGNLNEVALPGNPGNLLHIMAEPAALQRKAFELLDMEPGGFVPSRPTG